MFYKVGDYIIYGDDEECIAKISSVVKNGCQINGCRNDSAIIPFYRIKWYIPARFLPLTIKNKFEPNSDFYKHLLTTEELSYIKEFVQNKSASIIRKYVINYLYNPIDGLFYKKLLNKNKNMQNVLFAYYSSSGTSSPSFPEGIIT